MAFARFFDVSVDWLASGVGERRLTQQLDANEVMLLQAFRKLPSQEAELHLRLILARASDGETQNS